MTLNDDNNLFLYFFPFRCNEFKANNFDKFPEIHKLIVLGLCATSQWKRALDLDRSVSNSSLNILIRKVIRENEIDVMWELLNNIKRLRSDHQFIASKTCSAIAKYFERSSEIIDQNAEGFFRICESIEYIFDEKSAHELTRAIQRTGRQAKIIKMDLS